MGSVYLTAFILVLMLILAVFMTPLFLIPAVLLGLFLLFGGGLMAMVRNSRVGTKDPGPTGVPTTPQSSYDPVQRP